MPRVHKVRTTYVIVGHTHQKKRPRISEYHENVGTRRHNYEIGKKEEEARQTKSHGAVWKETVRWVDVPEMGEVR